MFINIFDNSYTEGVSGGNLRAIHIFRNIKKICPDLKVRLVSSDSCRKLYRNFGLGDSCLIVSRESKVNNFYRVYFLRLCKLIFWALTGKFRNQIIYANSDYLVDVLPAFFSKIFYKTSWIQISQLVIDHPKRRVNSFSNYIAWIFQRISFVIIKASDLVITDGYELKDMLVEKFKLPPRLVKAGFLGVDIEAIEDVSPSKESSDLVFVGTLGERKGVVDFIDICCRLKTLVSQFKATVIGGRDEEIKRLREKVGLEATSDTILFTGQLNQNQVFSYLKNAKILLFPSYNESWALVICEAMACGVLPLVRNLKVYGRIYEDKVVYCDSVQDFYAKAKFYLENDALRERLARKAKEFVRRYSWEEVSRREKNFIDRALNN